MRHQGKSPLPSWWRRFAGYERWRVDGTCGRTQSAAFAFCGWWPGRPKPMNLRLLEATRACFTEKLVQQVQHGGTFTFMGMIQSSLNSCYEWRANDES